MGYKGPIRVSVDTAINIVLLDQQFLKVIASIAEADTQRSLILSRQTRHHHKLRWCTQDENTRQRHNLSVNEFSIEPLCNFTYRIGDWSTIIIADSRFIGIGSNHVQKGPSNLVRLATQSMLGCSWLLTRNKRLMHNTDACDSVQVFCGCIFNRTTCTSVRQAY